MSMNGNGNAIIDSRAAAGMDDDELDPTQAVVSALGVPSLGDEDEQRVEDFDDGELDGDGGAEGDEGEGGEEDEQDAPEPVPPAQVTAWVDAVTANPQLIDQIPEEYRAAVGNSAQTHINQLQRVYQQATADALDRGMKYATYADLYKNDPDAFAELPDEEQEAFHDLTKQFRLDKEQAAKPQAPPPNPVQTELEATYQALVRQTAAEHPDVWAEVNANFDSEYGPTSLLTPLAAYIKLDADIKAKIAAKAAQAADGEDEKGGSSARRRQQAQARRLQQPRPDVSGGRGMNGSAAERLAAVKLTDPNAGDDLIKRALAGDYS
jgi:hypothetical protein